MKIKSEKHCKYYLSNGAQCAKILKTYEKIVGKNLVLYYEFVIQRKKPKYRHLAKIQLYFRFSRISHKLTHNCSLPCESFPSFGIASHVFA